MFSAMADTGGDCRHVNRRSSYFAPTHVCGRVCKGWGRRERIRVETCERGAVSRLRRRRRRTCRENWQQTRSASAHIKSEHTQVAIVLKCRSEWWIAFQNKTAVKFSLPKIAVGQAKKINGEIINYSVIKSQCNLGIVDADISEKEPITILTGVICFVNCIALRE